jgi:hypothetical protein
MRSTAALMGRHWCWHEAAFLTMLLTRPQSRLAQVRASGDSGQDLIEYAVVVAVLTAAGAGIFLIAHR